jgi:serine/threonine protein kinase
MDYGLAPINACPNLTIASPAAENSRWLAPEIIKPPPGATGVAESKPADIFAFAMLAIEVFTGKLPFEKCGNSGAANRILKGDRPELPQNAEVLGLTVKMWEFLQKCWDPDPTERPTIEDVVRTWKGFLGINKCVQNLRRPEPWRVRS